MKAGAQKALGRGLGCAILAGLGLGAVAVVGLVALAFPLTLSIVLGTLAALGLSEWRRRARRRDRAVGGDQAGRLASSGARGDDLRR